MTTTVESPAFPHSGLRPGDVVHRHVSRGPAVDAVDAAAALRGSGRIMLSCRDTEAELGAKTPDLAQLMPFVPTSDASRWPRRSRSH